MNTPETTTLAVFNTDAPGVTMVTIDVTPAMKLKEIAVSYFQHLDPDFSDIDRACTTVKVFHEQLAEHPPVPAQTPGAQWVATRNGMPYPILPEGNLDEMLAMAIKAAYQVDPNEDEESEAFLAMAIGLDLFHQILGEGAPPISQNWVEGNRSKLSSRVALAVGCIAG